MQRTQGATKAFDFIDACYRTHSLSSEVHQGVRGVHRAGLPRDADPGADLFAHAARRAEAHGRADAASCWRQTMGQRVSGGLRPVQDAARRRSTPSRSSSTSTGSRCSSESCFPTPRCRFPRAACRPVPLPERAEPHRQRRNDNHDQTLPKSHYVGPGARAGRRLAHAVGAGRQRAGRARPRHRSVLRARLQHRLARR